jgi:hypothetical protein
MKKSENLRKVKAYIEYAKNLDVHQVPTKGINSGAVGRALEMKIKNDLGNFHFSGVSSSRRNDTMKSGYKIEIKTAAGELANIDENGNITSPLFSSDYIIYAPFPCLDFELEQMFIVCKADEFYARVQEANLTRLKMSTAMSKNVFYTDEEKWKDKISLQFNSIKKENALLDILDEIGMSYEEFKVEVLGL